MYSYTNIRKISYKQEKDDIFFNYFSQTKTADFLTIAKYQVQKQVKIVYYKQAMIGLFCKTEGYKMMIIFITQIPYVANSIKQKKFFFNF